MPVPPPRSHPAGGPLAARAAWFARRRPELVTLLSLLAAIGGAWVFLHLGSEMREGETLPFDVWLLRLWRRPENLAVPIGPAWLPEAARDLTSLGSGTLLSLLSVIVVGFLFLTRKHRAGLFLLASLAGGALLCQVGKDFYRRPRPTEVPRLVAVDSQSFPSGHSLLSAVAYLTIAVVLARLVDDRRSKAYFFSVAVLLTAVVGWSRVYLGAHYPTDVLGGWTAGLTWAILCRLVARRLQSAGAVEAEGTLPGAAAPGAAPAPDQG